MVTAIGNAGRAAATWLVLATAAACAPGGNEPPDALAARQKVIVEFALPETRAETPDAPADPAGAMRRVADAILARLDAPAQESAQLYEHLPMLALEADGATLIQLLRMPEVVSVTPDRPVSAIVKPPGLGTIRFPQGGASR